LNEGKNFDSLLIEFGLPYNTIRRTNNPIVRLKNAITSFNAPMMNEAVKECNQKDLKNIIKGEVGKDSFYDILNRSVDGYMSFDYLNLLYDNGLCVHDILPLDYMGDLVKNFAHNMRSISRATNAFINMEGITDDEIKGFYNFKIERREDAKYIGYYLVIKMMIEKEKLTSHEYNEVFKRFFSYMVGLSKQLDVFEQITNLIKDKLDYGEKCDAIMHLAKYAVFFGSEGLKNFIYEKAKTSLVLKSFVDLFKSDYEKWVERQNKKKGEVMVEPATVAVTARNDGFIHHINYQEFIDNVLVENNPF
jgi:hypothetical protein